MQTIINLNPKEISAISGGMSSKSAATIAGSFAYMAKSIGLHNAFIVTSGMLIMSSTVTLSSWIADESGKSFSEHLKAGEKKMVQLMLFADATLFASNQYGFNIQAGVNGFLNRGN